jgi:3-hydroxybutyryl-CoA dehydrogenase
MDVYVAEFADSKYRPCPLPKEMVAARRLGRKTGQGAYKY